MGGFLSGIHRPVRSWGRLSAEVHHWLTVSDREQVCRTIAPGGLAFGNGRSYGDVCLNPGGALFSMRGLDHFIDFDPEAGEIECEAGVLLQEVLAVALPRGWFLPVVPGTQFASVGGAIANDVHGKSHHSMGSFGHHLLAFELVRTSGEVLQCSPTSHADWFAATVGGMGLTGVITRARLKLRRVPGPWLESECMPFESLERFFELSKRARQQFEYTVAWIDCASGGRGRGVFFQGNHVLHDSVAPPSRPKTFPVTPPISLINPVSLRLFNFAYFHGHKWKTGRQRQHYVPFFFPLDNLLEWNRIYGPRGFFQYQCVVPKGVELAATRALLDEIERSGMGSFLAVLKTFGDKVSPGMMSFPMPGTTLALDFPNAGDRTLRLFDRLNSVVKEAGGRIYPAKDASCPAELFEAGYPRLAEFTRYRDPGITSAMSRRILGS